MIFGSIVGFWGLVDLMVQLSNFKNSRWRLTAILDVQKMAITLQPLADRRDVWFYGGVSGYA